METKHETHLGCWTEGLRQKVASDMLIVVLKHACIDVELLRLCHAVSFLQV